jgi:nucleotide-binding universal stress UspA family protein
VSLAFFERVLVPVASPADARATAAALDPYLDRESADIVAVHVVEKAGGAPDKASVEQRELDAGAAFDAFDERLGDGVSVERDLRYGTDVVATIVGGGHDHDASAIVFTPRGGSRWVQLLTGDVTRRLVEESDLPVVVLPDVEEES